MVVLEEAHRDGRDGVEEQRRADEERQPRAQEPVGARLAAQRNGGGPARSRRRGRATRQEAPLPLRPAMNW